MISLIWLINGLACKVLNLIPRHQAIVSRILGEAHSGILTRIIGVLEILMMIWILSDIRSRWYTVFQILLVAIMNVIECIWVPDLLLFGRLNAMFALLFIVTIWINEFMLMDKKQHSTQY